MSKKLLCGLMFAVFCTAAFTQSPAAFTDGRWEGRISYRDSGGTTHNDLYEIIFVKNGTCIVTVRTKENGIDLFQDGDGLWSYDNDILHIECDFMDPVISRLPGINWKYPCQFNAAGTRFTLNVPPYPDTRLLVTIAFIQTKE